MANIAFVALLVLVVAATTANSLSCYDCIFIEGSPKGYGSMEDCRQNPPSKYLHSALASQFGRTSLKPLSNLARHVQTAFAAAPSFATGGSSYRDVCMTTFADVSVPAVPSLGLGAVDGEVVERYFGSVETEIVNGCYIRDDLDHIPPGMQIRKLVECVCDTDGCNGMNAPY